MNNTKNPSGRSAEWTGRVNEDHDLIGASAIQGLSATLSCVAANGGLNAEAPLLSHWLYFLPHVPLNSVGSDGHPKRRDFLPAVALPRRMWAGSDVTFHAPLRIGAHVQRRSVIADVVEKHGRTGALLFVNIDHELSADGQLILTERQSIVYREHPAADAPPSAPQPILEPHQWKTRINPDPVLLFRYSALTFNCHRIHYDRPYAVDVEGYPGLVVHAPLIATILLHTFLSQHPGSSVVRFTFRALHPLFDTAPFFACGSLRNGGVAHLFACDQNGNLCASATATLR